MPRAFLLVLAIYYGHRSGLATKDLMKLQAARTTLTPFPDIAAILLAGGASKRMGGENKAFIKINGKTIIEREIEILEPLFDRIIIVNNSFEQDPHPEKADVRGPKTWLWIFGGNFHWTQLLLKTIRFRLGVRHAVLESRGYLLHLPPQLGT